MVNPYDSVWTNNDDAVGWDRTDEDGYYSITVPPGTYDILVEGRWEETNDWNQYYPPYARYRVNEDLNIQSNLTHDIHLPIVYLSGIITNDDGIPASGVKVGHNYTYIYGQRDGRSVLNGYTSISYVTSGLDGRYSLPLLSATYDIIVTPPSDSEYVKQFIEGLDISANTTRNIVLACGYVVSGRVLDRSNNCIKNL
ncbi:unnamed protein product, partial [marine sediment metagenome]